MSGKNRTRQGKLGCMLGERKAESERSHVAPPETDARQNLVSKPQPCGDTQINRNGLN